MTLFSNAVNVTVGGGPPPPPGGVQVSITQDPGQLPVWHIGGLSPNGPFQASGAYQQTGAYGNTFWGPYDTWDYAADLLGEDSRPFSIDGLTKGNTLRLLVTDLNTGHTGSAQITLQ